MKKIICAVMGLILTNTTFAANGFAKVGINIALPANDTTHYLCIYDVGCMKISAANKGDLFPIPLAGMANLKKMVIADMTTENMVFENVPDTCGVMLKANQKITIQGKLVQGNKGAQIANLHCSLAEVKVPSDTQQV